MAYLNYSTTITGDVTLINLGLNAEGLIIDGQMIVAGAPDTVSQKYISSAMIQNIADGNVYKNSGTTASPVWTVLGGGGGGSPSLPFNSVQYNNGGSFFGDSAFTRDPITQDTIIACVPGGVNGSFMHFGATDVEFGYLNGLGNPIAGFQTQDNAKTIMGDFTDTHSHTYLLVDDPNQLIKGQSSNKVQFGDIDDNSTDTMFEIDVTNQNTFVRTGGEFSIRQLGNARSFFVQAPTYFAQMGDIDGAVNSTKFTVNDSTKVITANTALGFNIEDTSANQFFSVNTLFRTLELGDVNGVFNGTKLKIDDASLRTDLYTQDFYVRGYTSKVGLFTEITDTYAQFIAGDVGSNFNGTRIEVDTPQGRITNRVSQKWEVMAGLTNNQYFLADLSGRDYAFGDLSGAGNANLIWIEDDNNIISVRTPGYFHVTDPSNAEWLKVNVAGNIVSYGDLNSVGNDNTVTLNDSTEQFALAKNGNRVIWAETSTYSVVIGDGSQVNNLARVVVDNSVSTVYNYAKTATTNVDANTGVWRNVTPMGSKTLTDNTPTGIFKIALPAGGMTGGHFTVTVTADDGVDYQSHSDYIAYAAVNKGGVYTTQITSSNAGDAIATSSGTLTLSWTITTGVNEITIEANANSSLAAPTIKCWFSVDNNNGHQVTIL